MATPQPSTLVQLGKVYSSYFSPADVNVLAMTTNWAGRRQTGGKKYTWDIMTHCFIFWLLSELKHHKLCVGHCALHFYIFTFFRSRHRQVYDQKKAWWKDLPRETHTPDPLKEFTSWTRRLLYMSRYVLRNTASINSRLCTTGTFIWGKF